MNDSTSTNALRLGTRASQLARMQSQTVADAIEKRHPDIKVEVVLCKTSGDRIQDRPLSEMGGKGLFTKELEEALLAGQIDLAVHSFKDVPVTMPLVDPSDLVIAATPGREDPRDVLVCNVARNIAQLPPGARVGTGSARRRCQLLALRPDLKIEPIRGNIDTRLRKLADGQYDALVLALAGLKRSGLFNADLMEPIPPEQLLPAPGQGALAIQCRRSDSRTLELLSVLNDPVANACVALERSLVGALNGDCNSPIAALTIVQEGGKIDLHAAVGARGGELPVIRAMAQADFARPADALAAVMKSLEKQNVRALLAGGT